MPRLRLHGLAIAAGAILLASCTSDSRSPLAPAEPLRASSPSATLIECVVDSTRSVTTTIGPLGGVLQLGAHKISIPLNAVPSPTEFTLTVPASRYMEVEVRANGTEHFRFSQPVQLTIDYSRCVRSDIDKKNLRIFYIDRQTKAILEDLGGVDDKTARTVTTDTDHFSGFSVGSN